MNLKTKARTVTAVMAVAMIVTGAATTTKILDTAKNTKTISEIENVYSNNNINDADSVLARALELRTDVRLMGIEVGNQEKRRIDRDNQVASVSRGVAQRTLATKEAEVKATVARNEEAKRKEDVARALGMRAENATIIKAAESSSISPAGTYQPTGEVNSVDLTQASGYGPEHFNKVLAGTELAGLGEAIYNTEQRYGVNGLFITALARHESNHGESRLARGKNNLFGIRAYGPDPYEKGLTFDTKADCIDYFGEMISRKYFGQGRTTLSKINQIYAEDQGWASKVANHINRVVETINN